MPNPFSGNPYGNRPAGNFLGRLGTNPQMPGGAFGSGAGVPIPGSIGNVPGNWPGAGGIGGSNQLPSNLPPGFDPHAASGGTNNALAAMAAMGGPAASMFGLSHYGQPGYPGYHAPGPPPPQYLDQGQPGEGGPRGTGGTVNPEYTKWYAQQAYNMTQNGGMNAQLAAFYQSAPAGSIPYNVAGLPPGVVTPDGAVLFMGGPLNANQQAIQNANNAANAPPSSTPAEPAAPAQPGPAPGPIDPATGMPSNAHFDIPPRTGFPNGAVIVPAGTPGATQIMWGGQWTWVLPFQPGPGGAVNVG